MSTLNVPSSPAAIKKLEKHFAKEAKREDKEVKQALKDASVKAEQTVEKIAKAETSTLKALNKATHQHDAVLVDLRGAEREAEMMRLEDERLTAELDAKKARAAEVLQAQLAHAEERKTQIRELREGAGIATPDSRLSDASQ
ncbi:hypothetical protein FB451DRAFT_1428754 [Mycena latifolia]|nr:hypothetical protein FB451DRAFT_1428754 [Mycena latifolia]